MIKKTTELQIGDRLIYPKPRGGSEVLTVLGVGRYVPGVRDSLSRMEGIDMVVDFRHAPTLLWRKGRVDYIPVRADKTWVTA